VQFLDEPDRPAARSPSAQSEPWVSSGPQWHRPRRSWPAVLRQWRRAREVRAQRIAELERCLQGAASCSTCEECHRAAVHVPRIVEARIPGEWNRPSDANGRLYVYMRLA
jgi:hypothetical protein